MRSIAKLSGTAGAAGAILVLGWFAPALSAVRWTIDPARTHIAFAIDAVGYPRTKGEFRKFDGRIFVDFDRPERSSVVFHVESGSVDVGSSSFNDYIRSLAFLNADRFPTIEFVSKGVEKLDDHTVRVSGNLTMLGVTKPLSIDVAVKHEAEGGGNRLAFNAATQIDRLEYGMNSGFPLVSRAVQLELTTEANEH